MRGTFLVGAVLLLALTGCSGDSKPAAKTGPPPPPPSSPEPSVLNAAPGAKKLTSSQGLRKPITYPDKVSVSITGVRYVRDQREGRGSVKGQLKTIFTLKFVNGSSKPLNLDKVKVVVRYGPKRKTASPTSYANINDFYGTVAPGSSKSASYVFELPYPEGYKNVVLGVTFDPNRKAALFAGSLKP